MTAILLALILSGCKKPEPCEEAPGCVVGEDLAAGLLSVQVGTGSGDIWIVGASPDPADGSGPVVLHLEGNSWNRLDTSAWDGAELWWSWIAKDEAVFVGNNGLILEYSRSNEELVAVEGIDEATHFFGVWGASGDALWAVGQTDGGQGLPALWRRTGGEWAAWTDPDLGPGEPGDVYFKVHGRSADDLWIVGAGGTALSWDGTSLTRVPTDSDTDTSSALLLTVDAGGDNPIAVGGASNALLLEYDGSDWRDKSPAFQPGLNGVCTGADTAWTVGLYGARANRDADGTWITDTEIEAPAATAEDWHACAIDGDGGLWTVGGAIASRPLNRGVVAYQGLAEEPPAVKLK